jgi:hypothetical protein
MYSHLRRLPVDPQPLFTMLHPKVQVLEKDCVQEYPYHLNQRDSWCLAADSTLHSLSRLTGSGPEKIQSMFHHSYNLCEYLKITLLPKAPESNKPPLTCHNNIASPTLLKQLFPIISPCPVVTELFRSLWSASDIFAGR